MNIVVFGPRYSVLFFSTVSQAVIGAILIVLQDVLYKYMLMAQNPCCETVYMKFLEWKQVFVYLKTKENF